MAARGIESVPTLNDRASSQHDRSDEKKLTDIPEKMEHQAIGVTRIETLWRHFGTNRVVLTSLACTIFLVCCAFTLDGSTTSSYETIAVSYFEDHARLLGVIGTVEAILNAVSKPFIAKLADITSRQTAYCVPLVLYVLGYIIIASAQTGTALAAGRVINTVRTAGLDLVTDIIVADLTPLQWRGLFTAMTSMPYIWFAWIGGNITAPLVATESGWRWDFGMFCIIVPTCVMPAIILLFWADKVAQRKGEMRVADSPFERRWKLEHDNEAVPSKWEHFKHFLVEMDAVGLLLLGFAWTMLLLPFSLAPSAKGKWINPSMIAMLAVGAFLLIAFTAWEWRFARSPMLTKTLLTNRTFLLAVTIDFFYLWRATCAACTGRAMFAFAFIPVLIGAGGAFSVVGTRVASQASVPHHDLGQVIAQLALWTRVGGAISTAIASTTWQTNMQHNMRAQGVPAADIKSIYASVKSARTKYKWGSAEHTAVIKAYNQTVRPLFVAGLSVTFIPLICAILMPNFYLGNSHNKVERTEVAGRKILGDAPITHAEMEKKLAENQLAFGKPSLWHSVKQYLF